MRGNGTASSWSYGPGGTQPWPSALGHDLAGTAHDVTRTFTQRSAVGEVRQVQSSNDAYRFNPGGATPGYRAVNRGYNAADGLNRYSGTSTGTGFGYDGRGNLTSSATSGQATQTYTYMADNRLAVTSGGNLGYDPLDRLFSLSASGTRLRYGADGALAAEYNGAGAYLRRYVHGDMADEPLVWYEGTSVADRRWYHADERGSIIAVSNGSGSAAHVLSYDEHGVPGAANAGRFQYTGQTWLSEIGAYNYKARIYSPTLGRFLQTDPIGYGDGMNLYAYVGGDPVNATDPSGMQCTNSGGRMVDGVWVGPVDVCGQPNRAWQGGATVINPYGGSSGSPANCPTGWYRIGSQCINDTTAYARANNLSSNSTPQQTEPAAAQNGSLLRRLYRKIVSDPCSGKGTNEGAGVSSGYDPYDVDEKGSLAVLYGHVLPDHNFGSSASVIPMILSAIQTQPTAGSGGRLVYTVNTGQYVGYDARHEASSDYITVVMGRNINGARTLVTAYPGCR